MIQRIFLTFLGINDYDEVIYSLKDKILTPTPFVQEAIVEYYGKTFFDKIYIVLTEKSLNKNRKKMQLPNNVKNIIISEDLNPIIQWKGFETIIEEIEENASVYVDMTHGFRAVPIMFGVAINFLQQIKNIELKAVHYGVFDKNNKNNSPIIDFNEFFLLNQWSDAVSRVVENADTKKLAYIVNKNDGLNVADFNDPEIISSLNQLTDALKNVDVNNISRIASEAINKLSEKKKKSSKSGILLLDIVINKFSSLTTKESLSEKYDKTYFRIQLEIIKMLLEHHLFMQAFTAMREMIGSFGLIQIPNLRYTNSAGRKKRRLAEIFISMLIFNENEWMFEGETLKIVKELKPLYYELEALGLKAFVKEITEYRNGFDHAWTGKKDALQEIESSANSCFSKLKDVFDLMVETEKLH